MNHKLEFEKLINYDAGINGISLQIELRLGANSTNFVAKIDTGSTFCVFTRVHGETLGLKVEDGFLRHISTLLVHFPHTVRELQLLPMVLNLIHWCFLPPMKVFGLMCLEETAGLTD
jgi:hypothetical protein